MYAIRNAGAKGKGVFATKNIPGGSRIFAERPVLAVRSEREVFLSTRNLSTDERNGLLELSVINSRPVSTLQWIEAAWLVATNGFLPRIPAVSEHVALLARFRNNNFDIGDGVQAVFRDICRINHSCIPNSQGSFNSALGRFTIHAVQPIYAEEEVTISYLDEHGATRLSRRDRLLNGYGFQCDCPACDLSTDVGRRSEQRRAQLKDRLKRYVEEASTRQEPDDESELNMTCDLIRMFEEEGLVGRELATMYLAAAEMCAKTGQHQRAKDFAGRGLDLDEFCLGRDNPLFSESTQRMRPIFRS